MRKLSLVWLLLLVVGLLVQSCNPEVSYPSPLEGVVIQDQVFEDDETTRTIEVNTRLDNIAAVTNIPEENKPADWLSVKVGKTTLTLNLLENITIANRKAEVRLFHDAERTDMPNKELSVTFFVEQKRNKMFDSLNVEEVKMKHLSSDTMVSAGTVLRNVKIAILDKEGKEINWCTAKVVEKNLFIKVGENKDKKERQAFIRLYFTPQSFVADSMISKRMIVVTQAHNPVLDSLVINTQTFNYEEDVKVIKTNRLLTGIKPRVLDDDTKVNCTWLTAIVAGDSVTLKTKKLRTKMDRSANVTLYLPNKGEQIDSTTIAYSFSVLQLHNDAVDSAKFENRIIRYDQAVDTMKVAFNLTGFKAKLVDSSTNAVPKWLTASVSDHSVIFKASTLTSNKDRSATVTLYQPTNGEVIDSTTISHSFVLIQQHNTATDTLIIPDQTVEYNETQHVINVGCSLKGFKAVMVDLETELAPKWLSAQITEHQISFKLPAYDGLTDRRARVTIYQPNGSTIDENTIQHSFVLTHRAKRHLTPEVSAMEVDYTNHLFYTTVTSNVKYQIERGAEWIKDCQMTPIDDVHEKLTIEVDENKTTSRRTGELTLRSGSLVATISITQQTNPNIVLMDGNYSELVFGKTGGEFYLNVATLTPEYQVTKGQYWFTVGAKEQMSASTYRHKVTIPAFKLGPIRRDTIRVKNFGRSKWLSVVQHNYLYFEKNSVEVEEGFTTNLQMTNHTTKSVAWSSKNTKTATVDGNGKVTAIASGQAEIYISIGPYFGLNDYNDMCKVTVFNAGDKLSMSRAEGKYIRNGDYVTANCDLILTNNYRLSVTIKEVRLLGNGGSYDVVLFQNEFGQPLSPGSSTTIRVAEFQNVLKPSVSIKMTCNGKDYERVLTY
ncbi:MAG: Ig-like domain-containing protein [Prevotella sp.]|nr:Ig-like domain-containing protein [Prevotella sp.]